MNRKTWVLLSFLCFALFAVELFSSNVGQTMKLRADYYLKRNDAKNAIRYYEYAFEAGLKDSSARENYVDTVLSSMPDAQGQEKLIKFINESPDDNAKYKAESYITDLQDEVKNIYKDNYISNAPFNHKIIRWGKLPISFGFQNSSSAPDYYIGEIESAFKTWETESGRRVYFEKVDSKPDIIIKFNTQQPTATDSENEKYVVAYTTPVIEGNRLKNMIIDFFVADSDNKNFSENQIYNTALHEISHAIGVMGHSDHSRDVMYMSLDSQITTNDLRAKLSQRDIRTAALLYKTAPAISNTEHVKSRYAQSVVLGGEREITSTKIKEAKDYIRKAPNLPVGYMDLAEGLTAVKEYEKAIKSLNKALKLTDNEEVRGMIYYNLAIVYNLSEDYENAKSCLEKSMQIKDSESHHQILAEIYTGIGEEENAINEYENLMRRNPSNIEYTIALANIHVRAHRYLSARNVLRQYLQKNPNEKNNMRLAPYGIIKIGL